MKRYDTLWKGLLENLFDDFLLFFFKGAEKLFDLKRGFQFLDKELEQLFPSEEELQSARFVDKLVKVFTKEGKEEWFLIHVEVQGYEDKEFAKRLFTYFYRIIDKYNKPVSTIAIFTDANKKFSPSVYEYNCLGTSNVFRFNTYKIIEQEEGSLSKSKNPFAVAVLTVLLALKAKKLSDEDIFSLKFALARNLLKQKISKKKIKNLFIFLQFYVQFVNPEFNAKFEDAIDTITQNKPTMDLREMILEDAKKEGLEIGIEQGVEKGIKKGIEKGIEKGKAMVVKNLIEKMGMSDSQVAEITEVSVEFVKKIRRNLKK